MGCHDDSSACPGVTGRPTNQSKYSDPCAGEPQKGCPGAYRVNQTSLTAQQETNVKFGPKRAFRPTKIVDIGSGADLEIRDFLLDGRPVLRTPDSNFSAHVHQYPLSEFTESGLGDGLNYFPAWAMPANGVDEQSGFAFVVWNGHASSAQDVDIWVLGYYT